MLKIASFPFLPASAGTMSGPYPVNFTNEELQLLGGLWPIYFDGQTLSQGEGRLQVIGCFKSFLQAPEGKRILDRSIQLPKETITNFDYKPFVENFQVVHECIEIPACLLCFYTL